MFYVITLHFGFSEVEVRSHFLSPTYRRRVCNLLFLSTAREADQIRPYNANTLRSLVDHRAEDAELRSIFEFVVMAILELHNKAERCKICVVLPRDPLFYLIVDVNYVSVADVERSRYPFRNGSSLPEQLQYELR